MKIKLLSTIALISSAISAQTVIDFDSTSNWTQGSSGITSYANDHVYSQGDFSATGGDGLRNGNGIQDGFPGAIGDYSWRLRNNSGVVWTATIANGGVDNFSFAARRWDGSPSPDFVIQYSTDMGSNWTQVDTIDNTALNNSSDWSTFSGTINSANNDIMIQLTALGTTERIMIDNFSWSSFGIGGVVDTLASISSSDISVLENVGSVNLSVTLSQAAALDKTVDLVLNSGNAAVVGNYMTQSVTFPAGSTSQLVSINITPGMLGGSSETLEFGLDNIGSGLSYGSDTLFNLTVNPIPAGPASCSDLFISEYIEGSSNNKAIELYNPSTGIIDLSEYELRRYNNGGSSPSSTLTLSGSIVPGQAYAIVNPNADDVYLNVASVTSGIISGNGDDAYELYNTTSMSTIDLVGEIGIDPGASWTVGSGTTQNYTLVRMASVDAGAVVWSGVGDTQWDVYPIDDSVHLGSHTNNSCIASIPLAAIPMISDSIGCLNDSLAFFHNSFGGTAPYTVNWNIEGVNYSTDSAIHTFNSAGTINITLSVTDNNGAMSDSSFSVEVYGFPQNGMSFSTQSMCFGDTAFLTSTAVGNALTYSYATSPIVPSMIDNTGDGYFVGDTISTILVTQTITNFKGCSASLLDSIIVNPTDESFFTTPTGTCAGDTIFLTNSNPNGTWSGSGVTDLSNGSGYIVSVSGVYYPEYTTNGTCPSQHLDSVEIIDVPSASFTYTGSNIIDFSNTSIGSVSYLWDFGDGNTSVSENPSNTFTTAGTYTVCLTATNADGCTDSICESITIQGINVEESDVMFGIFPNPASEFVQFQVQGQSNITIIDIIGNVVWKGPINPNEQFKVSHFSKGTYFVQTEINNIYRVQKLVIE